MVELLKERNPGIDNPEAIEAMTPVVEQVAAVYGPQAAVEPEVIEQAFQSVGGAERFGPDPATERWERALREPPRDALSR